MEKEERWRSGAETPDVRIKAFGRAGKTVMEEEEEMEREEEEVYESCSELSASSSSELFSVSKRYKAKRECKNERLGGSNRRGPEAGNREPNKRPSGKVASHGRTNNQGSLRREEVKRTLEVSIEKKRARLMVRHIWRVVCARGERDGIRRGGSEERDAKRSPTAP